MKQKAPLCTKRAFFILYFIRLNAIEEKLEVIEEQVDEERGKDEVTMGVFGENTNSKDSSIVFLPGFRRPQNNSSDLLKSVYLYISATRTLSTANSLKLGFAGRSVDALWRHKSASQIAPSFGY